MAVLPQKFGIDFGNHSVKVVELTGDLKNSPSLVAFGSHSTPYGVISNDNEEYLGRLAQALKDAVKDAGIKTKYAVAAIPESAIFSRLIETPRVPQADLTDVVYWEAKQYLPIPIDEVQLDYMVLNESDDSPNLKMLIVAAPKNLVNIYVKVIQKAGFEPVSIETETVAVARTLSSLSKDDNILIIDMGSQSTDLVISSKGKPFFSQSIATGSDALTKAIAAEFSFEYVQAEEYKRNYGLDKTALEGKIYACLKPITDLITGDIQKALEFYRGKNPTGMPKKIALVGDGSLLPGLVVYFAEVLGMEVLLANPWENISMNKSQAETLAKSGPGYAVAVGLSLKTE